jgi:ABC-type Zn uptake system ZnuABC Zn-binding protein ZnuA
VRQYNVEPLLLDVGDVASLKEAIVENEITIVFFLIDAVRSTAQTVMIEALAEVRSANQQDSPLSAHKWSKNLQ